jgi:hypothetical protein
MSKSRKYKHKKKKTNQTLKQYRKKIIVPTSTSIKIRKVSNKIARGLASGSYSPTINQKLVTLKSIPRNELIDCNIEVAYKFKEPLQIGIPGTSKCYEYYTPKAIEVLLRNLAANKHVDPKKIIPPIQSQSNCWFNTMFVTFFVSDKGRKFFHFLRQLMIQGKQADGSVIPEKLRDAFALLNFGIDACLTGNKYAYKLNTNSIIHSIHKAIPKSYIHKYPYIVDIDQAGNPLLYYVNIINYLNNSSIQILFIKDANINWKDKILETVPKMGHLPHIIVIEVHDINATQFNKKPASFSVNEGKYEIDSAVIRDISKQHFCATITCEGTEMGYDGMSFHRLVDLNWKQKMNSNVSWQFEGTNDYDGTPLEWNFTKCYQLLMYYRVK